MNRHFIFWASVLIISLVSLGLAIRVLALHGAPLPATLVVRGAACGVLALVFALHRGFSVWPRAPRTQLLRALVAGLALSLFTLSYRWLSASAVAVLANIDVPLLLLLGPLLGTPSTRRKQALAALSILFLGAYVAGLESRPDLGLGLVTLALGALLLAFGYLFIKKSMQEENEAITIFVPSLAIAAYGLGEGLLFPGDGAWSFAMLAVDLLSGAAMFGAYYATMRLYEVTDIASAELPTLFAAVLIQPIELFCLGEPLQPGYFAASLFFVATLYGIMKWPEAAHA